MVRLASNVAMKKKLSYSFNRPTFENYGFKPMQNSMCNVGNAASLFNSLIVKGKIIVQGQHYVWNMFGNLLGSLLREFYLHPVHKNSYSQSI